MHIYSVLQFSPKHNNKIKVIFVKMYSIYGYSSNPKSYSIPKFNTYSTQFWGAHIWLIVVYYSYIWNYNHDNTILPTFHSIWFASCVIWARLSFSKVMYFWGMDIVLLWSSLVSMLCIWNLYLSNMDRAQNPTFQWNSWFLPHCNLCNAEPLNPKL